MQKPMHKTFVASTLMHQASLQRFMHKMFFASNCVKVLSQFYNVTFYDFLTQFDAEDFDAVDPEGASALPRRVGACPVLVRGGADPPHGPTWGRGLPTAFGYLNSLPIAKRLIS